MKKIQEVIVLGSGESILELSSRDIDYINSCQVVIAVNKFMAFYKKTGILPTHVYFVDNQQISTQLFLQHIFNVCRQDQLRELTFILNKRIEKRVALNHASFLFKKIVPDPKNIYRVIRSKNPNSFLFNSFLGVPNCNYEFISHQIGEETGKSWAKTLNEKLFHFRGSLTTVLNYISIKYPFMPIRLVGVDLNTPNYFFQKELKELDFNWEDWTSELVAKEKKHFSIIPYVGKSVSGITYGGSTFLDKMDFIKDCLSNTGNKLSSPNPKSFLVVEKFIEFVPIPS